MAGGSVVCAGWSAEGGSVVGGEVGVDVVGAGCVDDGATVVGVGRVSGGGAVTLVGVGTVAVGTVGEGRFDESFGAGVPPLRGDVDGARSAVGGIDDGAARDGSEATRAVSSARVVCVDDEGSWRR